MDRVTAAGGRVAGTGVDVTLVARMARWIADHEPRLDDVFTPCERRYCDAAGGAARAARYAAAFAAKEAVMKALGTGWRSDVEWRHIDTRGREPGLADLTGPAGVVARQRGVARVRVETTTADGAACAAAMAERDA